jgi:hypothetical protein
VEPGHHTVQVAARGKRPWTASVDTAADGATTTVTIAALEDGGAPVPGAVASPPGPPPIAAPGEGRAGSSAWRTVGLVAAGAGVASLIAGSAFGVDAMRKRDAAGCAGTVCPDGGAASQLESAQTSAGWSTALLVTGGALVVGGLAVWWVSRDHGPAAAGMLVTPAGIAGVF